MKDTNTHELLTAIGLVGDDLVHEAERASSSPKPHRRRKWSRPLLAGALAACILMAAVLTPAGRPGPDNETLLGDHIAALATYPTMAQCPDAALLYQGSLSYEEYDTLYNTWRAEQKAQKADYWAQPQIQSSMNEFFAATLAPLLQDEMENTLYSPLNLYLALALLAESTDGSSLQQILNLLNGNSIDALRRQAGTLWQANYRNDGAITSIPAASLWLNESIPFHQDTLNVLAESYRASSFSGSMADPGFTRELQDWIDQQTGGLLQEQAKDIQLDFDTVLALVTTLYYRGAWEHEFSAQATEERIFHSPTGDVSVDFLHSSRKTNYYWGDGFSAVSLPMNTGGSMYLLLPDAGTSATGLLTDAQVLNLLAAPGDWDAQQALQVNLSLPKFDVSASTDLTEILPALGVTDIFDPGRSDFSPLTDLEGICVTTAQHSARVTIDEEGCEGAAFTVFIGDTAADPPPGDQVDFVADRPFLFVLTSEVGTPLFAGIVNRPNE